jgi:hypothetical protein
MNEKNIAFSVSIEGIDRREVSERDAAKGPRTPRLGRGREAEREGEREERERGREERERGREGGR